MKMKDISIVKSSREELY